MKKKLFTLLLALVAIAMTAQAQNTNGHEYVDLGLPSGTLWATCNVGASKPEEYGYYFAWGETVGYTSDTSDGHSFDWANYKWCNGSSSRLTKYTGRDGKTELDLVNDAAYVNWGSSWRMPSLDQIKELIDNCNWEWTTLNGVYGRKATSKTNGNSIFLPAAGLRYDTSLYDAGSSGCYWSRSLYTSSGPGNGFNAYSLGFNSGYENWYNNNRSGGLSVRPIVVNNQSSELLLNAANFPDANFRAALASILGIGEGDEITEAKIAARTMLNVTSKKIANLTGIEHFTALTSLFCYNNQLTSLDVSKNTALTILWCENNQLTALDVSKNTALTYLYCYDNQLTSLDVSKSTALTYFGCYENQLTSLDVSKNTKLLALHCYNNQLTALDVSKNTALERLECYENRLTALDVSKNTALERLECYENRLTSLDVSKNTALTYLSCSSNQLTSLDVSKNTALTYLSCSINPLTSLDVSKNTALTMLYCHNSPLTSLDVSKNTALTELWCVNNQLTELDVSLNTALTYLNCSYNQLTALDVSKNTALTDLECYVNQINGEAMDALVASLPRVSQGNFYVINTKDENEGNLCTKAQVAVVKEKGWTVYDYNFGGEANWDPVEYEGSDDAAAKLLLNAENFPDTNFRAALASILGISEGDEITEEKIAATTSLKVNSKSIADLTGIEHFTALIGLYCYENQLTSLDVSKNTALKYLSCDGNQLTALDVSNNTALTNLVCENNQLTELDVSLNTALAYLYCGNNQLASLDVSKNTALEIMYCYNNQLASLDVSKNTALTELHCYNNQLTSLDVSKNTALTRLDCYRNQLTSLDVSKNTALTRLYCYSNQLTSLDVSKNTALEYLHCYNNQLTSLNVSKNTALEYLYCYSNQLTSLDVSDCTVLRTLKCDNNQLTSLNVSKNTALTSLYCFSNQIKGEEMDVLVASLATVDRGNFYVIDTKNENEGNVCTKSQVTVAKGKGWTVFDVKSSPYPEYDGSDPVEEDINPVDEDDNIDFGSDMDENDDLNGNVIGDIFYNIGNGNGEYNAEEGCIVLKKTTGDETVDGLSGKDIFGEDFKGQFTGIVFKVPSGKGTVKVTAETTGNMLLKVKIGDNDPVEMELNGKLKISFPYNVSETTLVAIYAGANNEAKGLGTTNATKDAALKIYGIEFIRDETTAIDASLNDNGKITNDNYYSIDGKKLSGEPTKKGIYIRNGRKIVK